MVVRGRRYENECDRKQKMRLLGSSLKSTADETLFLELTCSGYDVSKLRDEEPTAEIIKIG